MFFLLVFLFMIGGATAADGWTDLHQFLVPSDGSRVLSGSNNSDEGRDSGSMILFFDPENGDKTTAEIYWWDGSRIVDSLGNPADKEGREYGVDPLEPNEDAVKPFRFVAGDTKRHSNGYPDWFLFRRGRVHDAFDGSIRGGRSEQAPMVNAAYGPPADGRAVIDPRLGEQFEYEGQMRDIKNPFSFHSGGDSAVWYHKAISGLELHHDFSNYLFSDAVSYSGGVPTLLLEDCKMINASLVYLPRKTTVRRCISGFRYKPDSHNQGYYTSKFKASTTFEECIFYKNGYKTDPLTDPDPKRSIFDRNFYQGGGAQMGHVYRNIISADGGSGGPQMRLGGLCENSLIIEGYWYSSTSSNSPVNEWLVAGNQTGRSAVVRNNVQLVFKYPTANDPDTENKSDNRAQPGNGYTLQGASFGAVVENNIVSLAMLADDLGRPDASSANGFSLSPRRNKYQDSSFYVQKNDTVRGNISYRTRSGLGVGGDWTDVTGHVAENNVFVSNKPISVKGDNLPDASQLSVRNNRFYTNESLPDEGWFGEGNTVSPYEQAAQAEGWSDPDRTLKRYVTEVANLTILDWEDDPYLEAEAVAVRVAAGEDYDPAGLKTFMAVATNMRNGGAMQAPSAGKPSWTGDYAWDERFTAASVVNWIREGFGMAPVSSKKTARRVVNRQSAMRIAVTPVSGGGYALSLKATPNTRVSIAVHDLFGRLIRDLGEHTAAQGNVSVSWDGANAGGASLADRVYVLVCKTPQGRRIARKLLHQRW